EQADFAKAIDAARALLDEHPELRERLPDINVLEGKAQLDGWYQQAVGALQVGDRQTAQRLLIQVVSLDPGYADATRYLHLAVTGVDIAAARPNRRGPSSGALLFAIALGFASLLVSWIIVAAAAVGVIGIIGNTGVGFVVVVWPVIYLVVFVILFRKGLTQV